MVVLHVFHNVRGATVTNSHLTCDVIKGVTVYRTRLCTTRCRCCGVTSCESGAGEAELPLAASRAVPCPSEQAIDVAIVHEALVDDADLFARVHLELCRSTACESGFC